MLVPPCRRRRALLRRKGQPPAISTMMASTRTVQPAVGVSGASTDTSTAAMASGHEMAARRTQWSGSCSVVATVGVAGDAE